MKLDQNITGVFNPQNFHENVPKIFTKLKLKTTFRKEPKIPEMQKIPVQKHLQNIPLARSDKRFLDQFEQRFSEFTIENDFMLLKMSCLAFSFLKTQSCLF